MLQWLLELFKRGQQQQVQREREIFHFWDGERDRAIDPLLAWGRMWEDPECKIDEDLPGWQRNELECVQRIYRCVCRMFDLKDYDHGGLTLIETLDLFKQYLTYTDNLKKKHVYLPIPFRVWASGFSRQTSKPTKSDADLSGMPNESTPVATTGSGEQSSQPSATCPIGSG